MYPFRRKGPATVRAEKLSNGNWRVEYRTGLCVEYPETDFFRLYEPADEEAIIYLKNLKQYEKTHNNS